MVNGKQKGASFERDVCRRLSLWVSNGKQEDVYWRSSMSGGRSTVAYARGKRLAAQAGDISCIHQVGAWFTDKYLIECKHYADLNFDGLLTGKGNLCAFWAKLKTQAKQYGKLPFLVAKQNRLPTVVCVSLAELSVQWKQNSILSSVPLNMRIMLLDAVLKDPPMKG